MSSCKLGTMLAVMLSIDASGFLWALLGWTSGCVWRGDPAAEANPSRIGTHPASSRRRRVVGCDIRNVLFGSLASTEPAW
jgi:hypothetical protein